MLLHVARVLNACLLLNVTEFKQNCQRSTIISVSRVSAQKRSIPTLNLCENHMGPNNNHAHDTCCTCFSTEQIHADAGPSLEPHYVVKTITIMIHVALVSSTDTCCTCFEYNTCCTCFSTEPNHADAEPSLELHYVVTTITIMIYVARVSSTDTCCTCFQY